jgi:hypothetical protein
VDFILKKFPGGAVLNIDDVVDDKDLRLHVSTYLSYMSNIAVGLNSGIYDLDIFKLLAGKETLEWYDKLRPVLDVVGAKYDLGDENTTLYASYKELVKKIRVGGLGTENTAGLYTGVDVDGEDDG